MSDDLTISILREIRDEIRSTNTRIDQTNLRLDGVSTRLDGVSTKLDGVSTRLDGVSSKIDGVTSRLDVVEHTLQDAAAQVLLLGRYIKNKHEVAIDDLRARVTKLETKVG